MNAGAFVLCFRRKKYVCLFFLCEIASLVLFAAQIYIILDEKRLNDSEQDAADTRD